MQSRKKDLIFIIAMDIIAGFIYKLLTMNNTINPDIRSTFGNYILAVAGFLCLFIVFIGYLEAKGNDIYVTGNTQRMGVANSFTTLPVVTIIGAIPLGFIISCLIASVGLFLARELGRKNRKKKESRNHP